MRVRSPGAHLVAYAVLLLGGLSDAHWRTQHGKEAWECPDNGLFPDPHNCQWYYNCANGIAFHSVCPDGTYFDPRHKHCDWVRNLRNVNCKPPKPDALTTTTTPSPFGCPIGYSDVAGGCYLFSKLHGLPRKSWSEARSFCQSMSSEDYSVDLAVLENFSTLADNPILNYMNIQGMWYTWVGASYSPTENMWTWLDGRTLITNSSVWSPGQPNGEGDSNCGAFGRITLPYFTLFDIPCSWTRDYACQIVA